MISTTTARLTIELVPKTAWYSNLRAILKPSEWDTIRKAVYKRANNVCECCKQSSRLEAHEVWAYDDNTKIQSLAAIRGLCSKCHEVKHIGLTQLKGNLARARKHLAETNGWSLKDADGYVQACFEQWAQRSSVKWTMDQKTLELVLAQLVGNPPTLSRAR